MSIESVDGDKYVRLIETINRNTRIERELDDIKDILNSEKKKVVRVILRTYDDRDFKILKKLYGPWGALQLKFLQFCTIPKGYKGNKYDHVELLTPRRERFSIRMEKKKKGNQYGINGVTGVYCKPKNNIDVLYDNETKNGRYKLVFGFLINDEQEKKLYNFIDSQKGSLYNLDVANWNFFMRQIAKLTRGLSKKLMIDQYNNQRLKNKTWDCVTLIIRALVSMNILPDLDENGKKIKWVGYSGFDLARILIELYKRNELPNCEYVISSELQSGDKYNESLEYFYKTECMEKDKRF